MLKSEGYARGIYIQQRFEMDWRSSGGIRDKASMKREDIDLYFDATTNMQRK